ncbi:MAG TPA: aldose 1-epimerase family protein [Flavobacteriia bacterium]|nr:aldose 1-epimerase family protein [Flavobacteriia bacterium]
MNTANQFQYFIVTIFIITLISCTLKAKNGLVSNGVSTTKTTPLTKAMHTLKNKQLSVTILTKGAELSSIKTDSLEYLWQANPKVWPRHAPILFPIVGRLIDHEYIYKGKTYPMKQHGFARDRNFEVVEATKNSILFKQVSTAETKKIYPFDFVLKVAYTLQNNRLIIEYTVKNPSENEDLYFSIGAHPAFNCPLETNQKRSDYELVFDKKIAPKGQINNKGLFEGDSLLVFTKKGIIKITDSLFNHDSFAFNPNLFSKVTFVHKPTHKKYVSISFKNFPYLGIWSKRNVASYVCIEPWYGIADRKNHNKDFTQKEGIQKLAPSNTFTCSFTIEVFE